MSLFLSLFVSLSLYVSLCLCLSACLSACLSVCLSACLSACLLACLSVCLPACLSVCLSACLPACLSACLPACLSVCLYFSLYLSIYLSLSFCCSWCVVLDVSTSFFEFSCHVVKLSEWVFQWKLSFNPYPTKPSHEAIFSRKLKKVPHQSITFNNNPLNLCPTQRPLGLVLDSKLAFNKYIKHILSKITKSEG